MADELEQQIMRAIGLGMPYQWFNGSSTCRSIREEAARRLPNAIKKAHEAGGAIAEPDHKLCKLVSEVCNCEVDIMGQPSDAVLTKTWQVASYIIQAHLYLYYAETDEQRQDIIRRNMEYIETNYLQERQRQWEKQHESYWN